MATKHNSYIFIVHSSTTITIIIVIEIIKNVEK